MVDGVAASRLRDLLREYADTSFLTRSISSGVPVRPTTGVPNRLA